MENIRIDKGIKRKQVDRIERSDKGHPHRSYTQEEKSTILDGVAEAIKNGESTQHYADRHKMPVTTLQAWIVGNPEVAKARDELLALELLIRVNAIDNAQDALCLARAREGFRAWSWLAERRSPDLYGQKQEVTHKLPEPLKIVVSAPQIALQHDDKPIEIDVTPDHIPDISST